MHLVRESVTVYSLEKQCDSLIDAADLLYSLARLFQYTIVGNLLIDIGARVFETEPLDERISSASAYSTFS